MTAPDRTEELVLEMLARRAGGDVPADLLGRTLLAVAATPRQNGRNHHEPSSRRALRRSMLVVAGLVVLLPALLLALLAAGPLVSGPAAGDPGTAAAASTPPSLLPTAPAVADPSRPGATPPTSEVPAGSGFSVGSMALVILEGDSLRVRSLPTTDDTVSKRYKPTLPAGTRLLIVGGPVYADEMEWWQVQTDQELIDRFGWVSTGQDGVAWLEPSKPRCREHVDAATVAEMNRVEFLACYGDARVQIRARAGDWGAPADPADCGWARSKDGCETARPWLQFPSAPITLITNQGNQHEMTLAIPPELAARLNQVPLKATLLLTISMDEPDSASCRVRDAASGADVIPAERAITTCRLQFVIQEIAWTPSEGGSGG